MPRRDLWLSLVASVLIVAFAWGVSQPLRGFDTQGEDIYYAYIEGQRLVAGENPYARILQGDMLTNDKYATYFPLFYLFSALLQMAGWRSYGAWIEVWRVLAVMQYIGIGLALLWGVTRRKGFWFGLAAAAFWIASHWATFVLMILHLDLAALLLLVLSMLSWQKRRVTSLLLLSASLALKQIAVFVVPLYLVWAWKDAVDRPWRPVMRDGLLIAGVPLLVSVPFAIWNLEGYVRSLMFSVTRSSDTAVANAVLALSHRLEWPWLASWRGIIARLPMLGTMGLFYWLMWRDRIGRWMACLLVMATFISLNVTVFTQYLVWLMPLIPLAAMEDRSPEPA